MKPTIEDVRTSLLEADVDEYARAFRDRVASEPEILEFLTSVAMESVFHLQTWRIFSTAFGHVVGLRAPGALRDLTLAVKDPTEERFERLRRLFREHKGEIVTYLGRTNQRNFPVRAAALFPAVCEIASELGDPRLALVELGPSMGFNLCLDQFEYDYGDLGRYGQLGSVCKISYGLTLGPEWMDARPVLSNELQIVTRLGLEKSPLDWESDSGRAWFGALVAGAGQAPEMLEAAAAVRRSLAIDILPGDAVETLPKAVERVPRDAALCILESHMLYQVPSADRVRLFARIRELSYSRTIFMVSLGRFTMRGRCISIARYDRGNAARRVFGYDDSRSTGAGARMKLVPPLRIDGVIYHPFRTEDRPAFPL